MTTRWSIVLLLLVSCSGTTTPVDGDDTGVAPGLDATTGLDGASGGADGSHHQGDALSSDDADTDMDARFDRDSGPRDRFSRPDMGPRGDVGPLGPVCTELEMCCPTLPAGQMTCFDAAGSGDEGRCQRGLDLLRNLGQCRTQDAGPGQDVPLSDTGTISGDVGVLDALLSDTGSASVDAADLDSGTSTASDAGPPDA